MENSNGSGAQDEQNELIELLREEGLELFHTPDGEAYASYESNGDTVTSLIASDAFAQKIALTGYEANDELPPKKDVNEVVRLLSLLALNDAPEEKLHYRVAMYEGNIYLDLANADQEVVEIRPDGFEICENAPVRFHRGRNTQPLPRPTNGGKIEALRPLLNTRNSEGDEQPVWVLHVAWLISALHPEIPYPIRALDGPQGSGKSITGKLLRATIDPDEALVTSRASSVRDLMVAAQGTHVTAFDNLSELPREMSDALCRLSTGTSFRKRKLYTDRDETIISVRKPILLNGIADYISEPDLADRCFVSELAPLAEEDRQTEQEIFEAFEDRHVSILRGLIQAVSTGLENLQEDPPEPLGRMADATVWVQACEPALPWSEGTFKEVYEANREATRNRFLTSHPVARAIRELLGSRDGEPWEGRASDLLDELEEVSEAARQFNGKWPGSPSALSRAVNTIGQRLGRQGIDIHSWRNEDGRHYRILKKEKNKEAEAVTA